MRMEDVHHPHHHHPYQHQDMMRSGSMHNNNKLHNNNNNNILSSSMASMASLAASVGMSIPSNQQHLPLSASSGQQQQQQQQMMLGVQQQPQQPVISHLCAGCGQLIKDRYLLQALDSYWHEDCLKCSCCGCRLGEVGSNLFTKANLILCKRDYLRYYY